jgi:hypothetical protein
MMQMEQIDKNPDNEIINNRPNASAKSSTKGNNN